MSELKGTYRPTSISERYDWATTSLGPFELLHPRLQAQIEIVLSSAQPMYVAIGKDLIFIHNEAYRTVIAGMANDAFGQPMRKTFDAIWHELADMFAEVMDGRPQVVEDMRISTPWRSDEKIGFFSLSLIPILNEHGETYGFMASLCETTKVRKIQRALTISQARQAFLLTLSDALRPLVDPRDIRFKAAEILGRHLGASKVAYGEDVGDGAHFMVTPNYVDGTAEAAGPFSYADFGSGLYADLSADRCLVQPDIASDDQLGANEKAALAALDIGASMNVPLVKGGRLVAFMGVNYTGPHDFQPAEIELVREVAERTWDAVERARAEAALRESEERLRTLAEGIPQLVWRSAAGGHWTWSSPQWQSWTAQSGTESLGIGWLEAVHPDDRDAMLDAWRTAPKRRVIDMEHRLRRGEDGLYLWHHTRALPVQDENGSIVEWLGTTTEVQQLKQMQERQAVMVAELQHRTRNLIAVVKSIANQTMEIAGPTKAFREEFGHRLDALARVQGLLSRADRYPITIEALIRMELDALGGKEGLGHMRVEGPPVRIRPSVVQTLALALHELATNACKYGALSSREGRLDITWRTSSAAGAERLSLEWIERGGRAPDPKAEFHRGYGRELIEHALPYSLDAQTVLEHDEDGLRCWIDMPLGRTNQDPDA